MYSRDAKGIPASLFSDLMAPPNEREVRHVLQKAGGHKAAGHDGLDIDFWKLITAGDSASPCLTVLTRIIALGFELQCVPDVTKHGWITLVPKVKDDGSFSLSADKMRPITVLPELGKIASRLLAYRIGRILVDHPNILSAAQRGFIHEGNVGQCIDTLLHTIEDWKHSGAGDPLYVVSYDQSKAYDSVQEYSIQASLERFNMPDSFISYVLSSLRGATSQVRTAGGLTESFELLSSVRQGDPLAPLLYIIVTDALHDGLVQNPLFPTDCPKWGYEFTCHDPVSNKPVRTRSCGYADDTITVATSLLHVHQMHAWVREFFGAHCFSLNCEKTKVLFSKGATPPTLPSVDGTELVLIPAHPDTATIRYLGIWFNLELSWDTQLARMDKFVRATAASIRRNDFTLEMSVFTVRQFLLPCLRLGLLFAHFDGKDANAATAPVSTKGTASVSPAPATAPSQTTPKHPRTVSLKLWDTQLRQAAVQGASMYMGPSLSTEAFYTATGMPRLEDEYWALRGTELLVTRNAHYPSSASNRARMARRPPAKASRDRKTELALQRLVGAKFSSNPPGPLVRIVDIPGPWEPSDACWRSWSPYTCPVLYNVGDLPVGSPSASNIQCFTDGSTGPVGAQPSGCAVVVTVNRHVCLQFGFGCRPSGNNYLSEVVALIAAVLAVPAQLPVHLHTDALSIVHVLRRGRRTDPCDAMGSHFTLPARTRILTAVRPMYNLLRAIICARPGHVTVSHVKAHSGKQDFASIHNVLADTIANTARMASKDLRLPLPVYGDVRYCISLAGVPVIGPFRPALLRAFRKRRINKWAASKRRDPPPNAAFDFGGANGAHSALGIECPRAAHSSRLIAANRKGVLELSTIVQKCHDGSLLRFWALLLAEQLPTARCLHLINRRLRRAPMDWGETCRLCHTDSETTRHLFVCPALATTRVLVDTDCVTILRRSGIRVRSFPAGPPPPTSTPSVHSRGLVSWVHWVPLWFRPGTALHMQVCLQSPSPPPRDLSDALARAVGVLPSSLDQLLLCVLLPTGVWEKRDLEALESLRHSLQLVLLLGTHTIYQMRCRLMDEWWASPDATVFRDTRVRLLAKFKAQSKAHNMPIAPHPVGIRRSSRPPQPRQFSHAVVDFSQKLPCEYEVEFNSFGNKLPWY